MKTVYIIRHAKSDWAEAGIHDIERPLAKRGLRDAPVMAAVLQKRGPAPEIMVTSPAIRAFTTCRIFCENLGYDTQNIVIQPELYFGSITVIEKMLQAAFTETDVVALFGHNPTFSELAAYFTPAFGGEMPTCAIVAIRFDDKTPAAPLQGNGKLLWFEYPKKTVKVVATYNQTHHFNVY